MTETLAARKPLTGYHLKLIALATMILDHTTAALFPQVWFFRSIGRMAFPIYAFLIAEGCRYTRDRFQYAMRLGLFALISEIPYDLALHPDILEQTGWGWNFVGRTNVFYTLFFAVAIIHIFETLRKQSRIRQMLGIACEAVFFALLILLKLLFVDDLMVRLVCINVIAFVYVPAVLLLCRWLDRHPSGAPKPGGLANILALAALVVPALTPYLVSTDYGLFGVGLICGIYLEPIRK